MIVTADATLSFDSLVPRHIEFVVIFRFHARRVFWCSSWDVECRAEEGKGN